MNVQGKIFYDMDAARYHADPCPKPSLSSSIAKILIGQTPLHAWHAHPRLNPQCEPEIPDKAKDLGTVAHALLLRRGRDFAVVDADNWTTKAAKEQRAMAIECGKVAVLAKQHIQAFDMVKAAREQLANIDDCFDAFEEGAAEAVAVWEEEQFGGGAPIWCRSMIDFLPPRRPTGHIVVYDYKSTSSIVSPDAAGRFAFDRGWYVQAAFYERALTMLHDDAEGLVVIRFVIQQSAPPFALQVVELDPAGMMIGRKQVAYAAHLWRRCIYSGEWPGWSSKIVRAEMPSWLEASWIERELREADDAGAYDPFLVGNRWMPAEAGLSVGRLSR